MGNFNTYAESDYKDQFSLTSSKIHILESLIFLIGMKKGAIIFHILTWKQYMYKVLHRHRNLPLEWQWYQLLITKNANIMNKE